MTTRRSIIAAAVSLLTTVRSGFAAPRGVYDLDVIDAYATGPVQSTSCSTPTVTRLAQVARVAMRCNVTRNRKKSKRWPVGFQATVVYAHGAEIGRCSSEVLKYQTGPLDLSCDVPLPLEPQLPIELSGTGRGLSEPFWLPGGSLIFQTTAIPDPNGYGDLTLSLSTGSDHIVWYSYYDATQTEVIRVYGLAQARVNSNIDGPWRIVITDAFP